MSLLDVLGSKPRLEIVRELSREPKYVSELAETVGVDGTTIAHHLSVLEDAGVVDSYRLSNRKYYRLRKTIRLHAAPPPERAFVLQAHESAQATEDFPTEDFPTG